ncbi:uncharacterized protein LOC118203835 [Stegodyphus dumicola]|uniref:uncharacterized protein LOC118203835 n=1 Tax=Stegodyphus dumicola TaxID=202533 RepID=UPI0015B16962|nr:uncharacterized protein LOC118203835 [Stegodyphus dumicola]
MTLFSLKINSVLKELPASVSGSLYVDDLQISCQGADMRHVQRQLQIALNRIQAWSSNHGFAFSEQKTACVHFCSKRGVHPEPEFYIKSSQIPVIHEIKFLGLVFDRRLTFLPYIQYLRKKSFKILNILKVLANITWGAERGSMLHIYRAFVHSRLDYGFSCVWISTAFCSIKTRSSSPSGIADLFWSFQNFSSSKPICRLL